MADSYQLTEAGVKKLKNELDERKNKRGELAEAIATAREFGDLKENSEYADAKDAQGLNESRIQEIEHILQNVEIIDSSHSKTDVVELGDTVTLKSDEGKEMTYTIVGSVEANPAERKISNESPIGTALLGVKKGETVTIDLPSGKKEFTVKNVK